MARTLLNIPLDLMEFPVLPDLSAVPFETLDGTRVLGLDDDGGAVDPARAVRDGLPAAAFDALRDALGLPAAALAAAVGVAPRTLSRRRADGRFTADESDRLLRAARLAEMAAVALGDPEAAAEWMTAPHALFGEPPLRHADTAPGAREVEDALYAVEYTAAA